MYPKIPKGSNRLTIQEQNDILERLKPTLERICRAPVGAQAGYAHSLLGGSSELLVCDIQVLSQRREEEKDCLRQPHARPINHQSHIDRV